MRSALTLRSSVVLLLLLAVRADASETAVVSPVEGGAVAADLTEKEMLQIYGWMAGMRAGISRLGLSASELAAFQEGVSAAGAGEDLSVDLQTAGPRISQMVQAKFDAHMAALKADQQARATAFWEELRARPEVQYLDSGLAYTIVAAGNNVRPRSTDTIRAHYTGRLIDGTVFDTSEGGGPFETQLDRVIEGWTQGLPLVGEGGTIELFIPAELGYGDEGTPSIPPGATLIFTVELLEVIPSQADVSAPAVE